MEHKPKMPYPITIRVQALTMMTIGVDIKVVEASLGLCRQTIQYWVKKARERGYNPAIDFRILPEYVEDGKRSGRPKKTTESTEEAVLERVGEDSNGREDASEIPTSETGIFYIFLFIHPEADWLSGSAQPNERLTQALLMR
jgi:transposase